MLEESDFLKMSQMKAKLKKDFMQTLNNWETAFGKQLGWFIRKLYRSFVSLSDLAGEKSSEMFATGIAAMYRIVLSKAYDENTRAAY